MKYRIEYEKTEVMVAWVEAESESAARQAWIDQDVDSDDLIETEWNVTDVREATEEES